MLDALSVKHFRNVLEIGCGTGALTLHLSALTDKFSAIDISPRMLQVANNKLANFQNDHRSCDLILADILNLPANIREQYFDAIFFWGNGITHIPPDRYDDFVNIVSQILTENGFIIIQLRNGKKWIEFLRSFDLVGKSDSNSHYLFIYSPRFPSVGDMFEAVMITVALDSSETRIVPYVVTEPIQAYFNDCNLLLQCFEKKGIKLIRTLTSVSYNCAQIWILQRGGYKTGNDQSF